MKSTGTQKYLSNIMLMLVLFISPLQLLSAATDYNGNKCNFIALQSDGKLVMAGYSSDSGTADHFALARLINPMSLQTYLALYAKVGAGLY